MSTDSSCPMCLAPLVGQTCRRCGRIPMSPEDRAGFETDPATPEEIAYVAGFSHECGYSIPSMTRKVARLMVDIRSLWVTDGHKCRQMLGYLYLHHRERAFVVSFDDPQLQGVSYAIDASDLRRLFERAVERGWFSVWRLPDGVRAQIDDDGLSVLGRLRSHSAP